VYAITSVSGFLGAIVNTAKDWQDTMQSRLSGYSERIVEIRLDSDVEGGLNVGMDEPTIEKLKGYGELAAERIQDEFKFDQHRLNRAKVMFPALAKAHIQTHLSAILKSGKTTIWPNSYKRSPTLNPDQRLGLYKTKTNRNRFQIPRTPTCASWQVLTLRVCRDKRVGRIRSSKCGTICHRIVCN